MQIIRLRNKSLVVPDADMDKVVGLAIKAAKSGLPTLLCGESGTGKELIARLIHERSARAGYKFIAINCAAIPEGLMEAELFGFERGAFTGAVFQRIGKFELAHGGTILLDEISEMALPLQAKLLRVLQEGEIDRLGAHDPVKVNVRVIATSNKAPEKLIAEGSFREDLYYRLNVIRINCPPLRGRSAAIEILAKYFLDEGRRREGYDSITLSPAALQKLVRHEWAGNIRELENVVERALLSAESHEITSTHVSFERLYSKNADALTGGKTLSQIEKESILAVLKASGENRTSTANELGISARTLRNKLKEYRQE